MTGSKRNKNLRSKILDLRSETGQILLITIMLLATALTVVLSVSFKSVTETQVTKLEEESQKALAVAEAGIEAALKDSGTIDIRTGLSSDINAAGFSGSALCSETNDKAYFVSPLLQKDEQYTFYLADYPGLGSPYGSTISIYYGSEAGVACNDLALEVTLIADNTIAKKWIIDPGNKFTGTADSIAVSSGGLLGGTSFNCKTDSIDLSTYTTNQLLIIRSFYNATKVGFLGTSALKPQGKTCDSEASSSTGATKKVTLFQSYPQIPAEFFVTSF